ncbi:helix-hairpin-helix domain-containing protein [Frisingicoccus sp.]|uniref:helix-hairpin-helix domain-containing protein n=1 Tax=Frisingicoccus sp. TaxID=1918627 RepID=UPI003AB6700F
MSKWRILMSGFMCLLFMSAAGCGPSETMLETGERLAEVETEISAGTAEMTEAAEMQTVEEESEELIYVYVCGQVRTPGVYSMAKESRLFQAVDMAGGILPEGDLTRINLALSLEDGQKIYIPSKDEAEALSQTEMETEKPENGSRSLSDGRVNINRASKEALMTLPGIGEAKADAILAYRQTEGDFESVESLMQVPGIKEGVFAKIKDRISID